MRSLVREMKDLTRGNVQLHVPLPSELSAPSQCGSTDAVEEMLITLAGLRLVEPFARRSERLKK